MIHHVGCGKAQPHRQPMMEVEMSQAAEGKAMELRATAARRPGFGTD
jgi:hypothetical protein